MQREGTTAHRSCAHRILKHRTDSLCFPYIYAVVFQVAYIGVPAFGCCIFLVVCCCSAPQLSLRLSCQQMSDAISTTRAMYEGMAGQYESMIESDWAGDPLQTSATGPTCRAMLRAVEMVSSKDGLVCDVGCGPGFNLQWLATGKHDVFSEDKNADLRGFDLSPSMIELAKKRCCPPLEESQLRTADMTDLSSVLTDGESRCLFNLCTVQHFEEKEIRDMLASARRVLTEGGILLLQFWSGDTDGPMPSAPEGEVFLQYTRETMAAWVQVESLQLVEESEGVYEFDSSTPDEPKMLYRFFFLKA